MNWYAQAIEELEKIGDARAVLFKIAAKHPKVLVDACRAPMVPTIAQLVKEKCRNLMLVGKKVEAVKLWRSETGCDLKEALEQCSGLVRK